ncbi:hypothetical protein I203_106484 [Kwoniella mangroviensis CBS 8507]|uniref:uncharacterized protein n=1 Tax=Kwoniella mangroviensis CBS 8507 TaxID=1296122 RepID=UPI0030463BCE
MPQDRLCANLGIDNADSVPFVCIVAPPFALLMGIIHGGERGILLDSSWRNKNAHKAPLTLLCTLSKKHRMVPIAAMVSAHANHSTYHLFLHEVSTAIQNLARRIVNGTHTFESDQITMTEEDFISHCRIIAEDGFFPRFAMIDGDDAERIALELEFPHTSIRMCQFHLMQACRSRAKRELHRFEDRDRLAAGFLSCVRSAQRCPSEDLWPVYKEKFRKDIANLADQDEDTVSRLMEYMNSEWFSERWRAKVIDYGMPASVTRDGPWSTNNYVEAAFRTFDRVFLSCRANKRLDRLIAILINSYFPFYENVPPADSRADPGLQKQLFDGMYIWEINRIKPCESSRVPLAVRCSFDAPSDCYIIVWSPNPRVDNEVHFCGKQTTEKRNFCTCSTWRETGKRCAHLWAATMYETCGSLTDFESKTSSIKAKLLRHPEESGGGYVPIVGDREELNSFWKKDVLEFPTLHDFDIQGFSIPDEDKLVINPSVRPDNDESNGLIKRSTKRQRSVSPVGRRYQSEHREVTTSAITLQGRPKKVEPLHPYRSKARKFTPSTLSIPPKQLKKIIYPTGTINTGNDCYAIALFQMLARNLTWTQAFTNSFATTNLSNEPTALLFAKFMDSINEEEPTEFPDLGSILAADSPSGQEDPVEVFTKLLDLWDSCQSEPCFDSLFSFGLQMTKSCDACFTIDKDSSYIYVDRIFRISPKDIINSTATSFEDSIFHSGIGSQSSMPVCSNPFCAKELKMPQKLPIVMSGNLLGVQINWNLHIDDDQPTVKNLTFPEMFSSNRIHLLNNSKVDKQNVWRLNAVICRTGSQMDHGHYLVIIKHGSDWFIIDDHRRWRVNSTSSREAFASGRYPTFLLYQSDSGSQTIEQPKAEDRLQSSRSKKRKIAPTNETNLFRQEFSVDEVIDRYKSIPWMDNSDVNFLMSESMLKRDENTYFSLSNGIFKHINSWIRSRKTPTNGSSCRLKLLMGTQEMESDDINRLCQERWWSSNINAIAVRAAQLYTNRYFQHSEQQDRPAIPFDVKFVEQLLPWYEKKPVFKPTRGIPFPRLGKDRSWRDRVTISIINVEWQAHFATVVIFGPQKLLIPFDGAGGAYDNSLLKKRWTSFLNNRLEYEETHGWVTAEENKGWVCANNTDELRSRLNWIKQEDGHSCGPLAVSAAVAIAHGLQPSIDCFGFSSHCPEPTALRAIRDLLIAIMLSKSEGADCANDSNTWYRWPTCQTELREIFQRLERWD